MTATITFCIKKIREEKTRTNMKKEREEKEKLSHRLIDEDEIISFNPKSIKTILIYLIYFPPNGVLES